MSETPTSRTQQHWAEAVAECVTDEQEALRLVRMYEEDEWPKAMLDIGRTLLATRRALTAERAARERAEAERDALRARVAELEAIAAMLGAVVQGAQEEFVRVPYGASHEDVAQINEWHKMAQEARAALAALERGDAVAIAAKEGS